MSLSSQKGGLEISPEILSQVNWNHVVVGPNWSHHIFKANALILYYLFGTVSSLDFGPYFPVLFPNNTIRS